MWMAARRDGRKACSNLAEACPLENAIWGSRILACWRMTLLGRSRSACGVQSRPAAGIDMKQSSARSDDDSLGKEAV